MWTDTHLGSILGDKALSSQSGSNFRRKDHKSSSGFSSIAGKSVFLFLKTHVDDVPQTKLPRKRFRRIHGLPCCQSCSQSTDLNYCDRPEKGRKNVVVVAVHPGVVATRLSGWSSSNDMEECMPSLADLIGRLAMESTGTFLNFDGRIRAF